MRNYTRKTNRKQKRGKHHGSLELRGATWFARWMVNGKYYTRSTGTADRERSGRGRGQVFGVLRGVGRAGDGRGARQGAGVHRTPSTNERCAKNLTGTFPLASHYQK